MSVILCQSARTSLASGSMLSSLAWSATNVARALFSLTGSERLKRNARAMTKAPTHTPRLTGSRRRDPVKRGVWVGALVIALAFLFSLSLPVRLNSARATLVADHARLESIEPEAKEVRADWQRITDIEKRTENLVRYATN